MHVRVGGCPDDSALNQAQNAFHIGFNYDGKFVHLSLPCLLAGEFVHLSLPSYPVAGKCAGLRLPYHNQSEE